jgi:murein DD-endopeptidase MepM/ murein hydrolase activator NlpD
MSRRLSSYCYQSNYPGHASDGRGALVGTAVGRGYALVHAGRQLRLGPIAFWVVVGTLVIMALWTVTTATYFAFREDVLTRLIARQADMQFGYEDRIAELRAQIDRISSRQLLDQEQYEQKLEQVLRRQSMLEQRSFNGLPDPTPTGSIKPPARGGGSEPARGAPLKPSPINDLTIPGPLPDRHAHRVGMDGVIARINASLDRVEQRQSTALNSIEETYDAKARRLRGVLSDLGLDAGKIAVAGAGGATGGPFVPARLPAQMHNFEQRLQRVSHARAQVDRLTRTLSTLPVRRPLSGDIELSSGFGVRSDPFTRSPAMHTGLDFQGDIGDPVRATANGTVTAAGWSGGYGKVVDIDHGNGFSTRYGHLSAIDVHVGQTVKIGQAIGKLGSTGRSTGPHLHYETRVRGEAVDPQKFLRAGQRLDGSL